MPEYNVCCMTCLTSWVATKGSKEEKAAEEWSLKGNLDALPVPYCRDCSVKDFWEEDSI